MIYNIRGTSGSGKTHLARSIMALFPKQTPVYQKSGAIHPLTGEVMKDRKQPMGYVLEHPNREKPLYVLGHYNTACGGADTLKGHDYMYYTVQEAHSRGYDVLFESLLLSVEANRALELGKLFGDTVQFIQLTTPVEECIASINQRRLNKNAEAEPVNEDGTRSKYRGSFKIADRLDAQGNKVHRLTRDEAFTFMRESLNV